ncbi:hypothetical protein [Acinetobacter guillouiae]|uniref:hypothetical protein n=1 Tax=Acinetobacter guillouiae TaxID=106649 RepID=UPI002FDB18C1
MSHSASSESLSIMEIATLIIKDKGIHEGLYVPKMELAFGAGVDEFNEGEPIPTVKVGIKSIGIERVEKSENMMCVDAGEVNPKPKRARSKKE